MTSGDATRSVIGIGRAQPQTAMMAMPMGGHMRVGLEDSISFRRGALATGNAQLVARVVRLAAELGRPVATPAEARRLLGLAWSEVRPRRNGSGPPPAGGKAV
ncbi:MAG: 3-keto-5-aminohexanoate cleavage protein [Actinobacteria bacterium]|nr:3-keto-5-aminohexanoate cleavage protein [Actinomycetota bacterium]